MNTTIIFAITAFLLVVLPLVAGTILGWVSVVRIHRSEGRLFGLGFALYAALLVPLLFLDGLIMTLIAYSGPLLGFYVAPLTVIVLGVPLCGLVDFWIVRASLGTFTKSSREAAPEADHSTVKTMSKDSSANKPGPFRRFWWLFLVMPPVCLLIGLIAGGFWFVFTPKQYEARSMLEIGQQATDSSENQEIALSPGDPQWITRLNAIPVLDQIIKQLDLARSWSVDEALARQSLVALSTFPVIPGTNLRELRIRHTDASEASAIANAWAQALKANCAEHHPSASIKVLEAATTPERPFFPRFDDVIFLYGPIGLFISPLLTVLLILVLHHGTRWLTRAIITTAGLIVVSIIIVYGYVWIARYFAFSNASPVISETTAPLPVVVPATPEQAAISFMEAIRDGDIDAAMRWIDPKIGGKEPWKSIRPIVSEELKKISDELRNEAYVGNLNRLTEFTEWYPDPRKVDSPYLAVRVAAPTGGPEDAVKRGLYLILSSTPEGWRVALYGDAGSGKSLSEHFDDFLGIKIIKQSVKPTNPDDQFTDSETPPKKESVNLFTYAGPEKVARWFMQAIRDGDMDNAMEWLSPELKQKEKFPLHLELASKILRDEIYAGQLERLTQFTEKEFTNVDGTTMLLAVRVTPPAESQIPEGMGGPVLILSSTPDGWRVVHFGEGRAGKSLSEHVKEFQQMHPTTVVAGLAKPETGPKQVELLDCDAHKGPVVLDLASGELLEVPKEVESQNDFASYFNRLGKGDLAWDGVIVTLRGARLSEWLDDGWTLRNPEEELDGAGGYRLTVPSRLRITTAEGGHYIVDVREKIVNEKGVRIEYQLSNSSKIAKNAAEATNSQNEKRRIVLPDVDAPHQGPVVLDLASHRLLDVPEEVESEADFLAHFNQLGKGDLAWDSAIITLRGARVSEWLDDSWTLRNPERELDGSGVYRLTVPTRLRITTAEGTHYLVDVNEEIENDQGVWIEGVWIEYQLSNSSQIGKNAVEATSSQSEKRPMVGAEIQRFVLGLPVQPPVAVPKDSPLTIDQIKEVLKGVTWGELLTTLGNDSQGDILVTPRPSPDGDRYEIFFPYGTGRARMDLAVDWKFRRATPLLLRATKNVGVQEWHVSEFLPEMVVRYAMETNHPAASRILDEDKAKGPTAASTFDELYRVAKLVHSSGDYVLRTRYTDYSGMPADKVSELKRKAANESHKREIGHTKASVLSIEEFEKKSAGWNVQRGWNIRPQKIIVLEESHRDFGYEFVFGAFERDGKWRFSCAHPYWRYKHLKGVLKRTVKALSPYRLELDGTTDTIYLRGKSLEAIPDGTRIGVTGFIRSSWHDSSNDPTPTAMPSQRHIYMEVTRCKWLDDPADEAGVEAVPRTDFDPRTTFVPGTDFGPGTTVGPLRVPLGEAITIEGKPCAVGFGGEVKSQSMESISKHGLHSLEVQKVNGVELKEPVVISFTGNAQFEPASYYMIRGYQTVEVGPGNPDPDDPDATAPQGNDDFRFRFVADKEPFGNPAPAVSGIHVIQRTPTQWVFEYVSDGEQALSHWIGTRDNAGYLIIPERSGRAKLISEREGLILETGSQRVGPIPMEDFTFAEGSPIIGDSLIVGRCSKGLVGIRLAEVPPRSDSAGGTELTPDFEQATREFHFKVDPPSLLTRGTAHYLVIPVAIESEDYIIKRVDWRGRAAGHEERKAGRSDWRFIDLSLVLEPSAKGNATTTPEGKPRTTQNAIVGINLDQTCQIRYANPDGTFVDLMTVDPLKVPTIPPPERESQIKEDIDEMLTALSGRKVSPGPYIDRIVQHGAEAVPILIVKYYEVADEKRWALVACLCRLPTPESRKFLMGVIQGHADRQSTSYAIEHYPISHEDEIVGILIETLPVEYNWFDASERLRKMIFRAPALAGELVAALVDEKSSVPQNHKIHDILAHVSGYANAWPNRTPDGRITPESENEFWRQWWERNENNEIFDWLIEALYRDNGGRRSYALQILGTLDDKRAIPHFLSALGDDVFGVRYWAVVGLKKMAGSYPEKGYTSETFKKEEASVIAEVKALVGKLPKDDFAMPLIADEILPGSTQVCFMLAETDEPIVALYPKGMKVPEREVPIQVSGRVQVVTSKAPQAGEEKIYMRYRQTVLIVDSWGGIE